MKKKSFALVPVPFSSSSLPVGCSSIVETFLSGRNRRTLEAYGQDLQDFARFLGVKSSEKAARSFLGRGKGDANAIAHAYQADLLGRGLSPSTVNRRLAALRSLVKLARLFNLVDFTLDVDRVKSQPYRDTRGPGCVGVRLLLDELDRRQDAKAMRDRVVVRLLYDLGLRRGEAVALDLGDVDFKAGTLTILGKGRTERETLTLPEPTKKALQVWAGARGMMDGPLFVNFDRAGKGSRLTGRSVARIIDNLGEAVGLKVRPHGLRHAAITEALDKTNGNFRMTQKFSRHRDPRVLGLYDDNRQDLGGEVARLVAASLDMEK
jgi:integrase/recombinase XerC